MMSYVLDINPFKGVLCVPYYHLFIPIITSWLLAFLCVYYAMRIDKYYNINVVKQQNQIGGKVPRQIQQDIKTSIQSSTNLPNPIISIIAQMLPKPDEFNQSNLQQKYKEKFEQEIERKALNYLRSIYIYPIIRYTINFINFINIMVRYGKWVNDTDIGPWYKYTGFILVWFYMHVTINYSQRNKDQKYYDRNVFVILLYQMMKREFLECLVWSDLSLKAFLDFCIYYDHIWWLLLALLQFLCLE